MPPAINRPQKITFAEMRAFGVRGVLIDSDADPPSRRFSKKRSGLLFG
jgi:hypothetical protein